MTTPNTYLDDFMDRMITVPNDINRLLRLIRKLDKKLEQIQVSLVPQQAKFMSQIKQLKDRKVTELPAHLKAQMQVIARKQKQIYGYSKQKKDIADQLLHSISEFSNQLVNQLKLKYKDKPEEEIMRHRKMKIDASKVSQPIKKENFQYDFTKDPQYCYCGRHSFGQMVACENPYCQREWFHTVCLEEKNLPEKWYCSDCQKQRDKTKNPNSRSYFVNKQNV